MPASKAAMAAKISFDMLFLTIAAYAAFSP
jgi:hypothetical protein